MEGQVVISWDLAVASFNHNMVVPHTTSIQLLVAASLTSTFPFNTLVAATTLTTYSRMCLTSAAPSHVETHAFPEAVALDLPAWDLADSAIRLDLADSVEVDSAEVDSSNDCLLTTLIFNYNIFKYDCC